MDGDAAKSGKLSFSKAVLAVVAAVWALVSGALGAVLVPELKDRFFPPKQEVTITRLCLQPGVQRGDYLEGTGNKTEGPAAELARIGFVAIVSFKATGFKGDNLDVRGAILDEKTKEQRRDLQPLVWGRHVTPGANEVAVSPDIWMPQPLEPGSNRLAPRVNDSRRRRLTEDSGIPFSVGADRAVSLENSCETLPVPPRAARPSP